MTCGAAFRSWLRATVQRSRVESEMDAEFAVPHGGLRR